MSQIVFQSLFARRVLEGNGFAQSGQGWDWSMGHGMMWASSSGWLGALIMILFWVVVLVGIVSVVRWLVGFNRVPARRSPPERESPLDILKRRYASGEISKEQYDSMRRDIGS